MEESILTNISLRLWNTFSVDVKAKEFSVFSKVAELQSLLRYNQDPFVLGGGSNMLLTEDIDTLVLKNQVLGIQKIAETQEKVLVKCGAGEQWHDLVVWAVAHDYGGIENLSLIPGCAGAAPIQNIGAYGVELEGVFHSLEAVVIETGELVTLIKEDCNFGYRNSIFKNELLGKYIITSISLELTTQNHNLSLAYGNISSYLNEAGIEHPSIKEVSDAVIAIRQSKLPDPNVIGNSGSFFKNPIVSVDKINELNQQHPDMPNYKVDNALYKIPAAWLIDKLDWKSYRAGDAGVYENHALVLVNHGDATGKEILHLANEIQASVQKEFGIMLQTEVNIY